MLYNVQNIFFFLYSSLFQIFCTVEPPYITLNHISNSLKVFERDLALIKPLLNLYWDIFPGIWDRQDGKGVFSLHVVP